jgi:hypothetical protein
MSITTRRVVQARRPTLRPGKFQLVFQKSLMKISN